MHTVHAFISSLLFVPFFFVASSCSSDEDSLQPTSLAECNVSLVNTDVWTVIAPESEIPTRVPSDGASSYCIYLYNPKGEYITFKGNEMSSTISETFREFSTTGTYTLYGYSQKLFNRSTDGQAKTISTPIPLTLSDIHLGSTTVTVANGTISYTASISAAPIMSKLALTVTGVPNNISTLKATLPNRATHFTLAGAVSKSGATGGNVQTVEFTKGSSMNSDGTFTWSLSETLVYPMPDDASAMAINIVSTDTKGNTISFSTQTDIIGKKNTRVSLSATYNSINATTALSESAWTGEVISGTLELGTPTIQ